MRNFINIRDNFVIAAADRVIVAAVDVIRNGFASRLRLYCQAWQHCAHTVLKHTETGGTGRTSESGRSGLGLTLLSLAALPVPGSLPSLPGLALVPSPSRWMRSPGSLGLIPRS